MRRQHALLTERELAAVLRCSVAGVRAWRRRGMPARKLGRLVRYELESVLRWHAERAAQ
jgi:phage terminase Nu1 subunit (DNA packaging protein)